MSQPRPPDAGRRLHQRLAADLRDAMRARDRVRVRTIRSLMSAIDNAEAVPVDDTRGPEDPIIGLGGADVSRQGLDAAAVAAILDSELAERVEAATTRRGLGRTQDAAQFDHEADIIRSYRDTLTAIAPTASG